MTCIVAIKDNGNIHMAGDLMGSDGFRGKVYDKSKVFIKEGFILGYTSSFRMGQLLEYAWVPPTQGVGQDDDSYIYVDVVNSFKSLFMDNGFGNKDKVEIETGEFIFGWNGRLFLHQSNHSLLESDHYVTTGSGCYHAEAAIASLIEYGHKGAVEDCEFMLSSAIEVASRFVTSVSKEYTYKVLEGKE